MLELSDKDIQAAVIKIVQQKIMNGLETDGKVKSSSKDPEDTKKNEREIL